MKNQSNSMTSGNDAQNMSSDDNFLHKVHWYSVANASARDFKARNQSKNADKMDDSMDVCNYRIIENYTVNRINVELASPKYEMLDASGLGWNTCLFNKSSNVEDSLDICNYRQNSGEDNSIDAAPGQQSSCESVIVGYPNQKKARRVTFASSSKLNNVLNASSFEKSVFSLDQSCDSSPVTTMEDSIDIYSYRQNAPRKPFKRNLSKDDAKLDSPIVCKRYFRIVPNALFMASPVTCSIGPVTSSPFARPSSRRLW